MTVLKLTHVRLSFPNLWVPKAMPPQPGQPEGKPTYSANFLIHPDDPQIEAVERVVDQVAAERWKEKAPLIMRELRGKDRVCLHNGDYKADYDGYPGMYFLTARNAAKPLVIDRDPFIRDESGQPVIDPKTGKPLPNLLQESSGRPFGGCYVNCSIDIYAQDRKDQAGKRINATLRGVQYMEDGDAFAGGPPASPDEFDDLTTGGQASSLVD